MTEKQARKNVFEFVMVASARARQLAAGCVPRVEPAGKVARTAQREVLEGAVKKVDEDRTA